LTVDVRSLELGAVCVHQLYQHKPGGDEASSRLSDYL
jgi:hypothetical protein